MLLIWGFKSYATLLATGNLVCARCGNPAAHRLHQLRRKFTLFFIPLFPVSTKYFLDCTFCGQQTKLTKEESEQTVERLNSAHPAPQQPQVEQAPQQPTHDQI